MRSKINYIIGLITCAFFITTYSLPCNSATITCTYDNLNRLTKVVYGNGMIEEFNYDAAGNRLTHVVRQDNTPPTGSITINNNEPYTNSTSVTLTLSATDESGVAEMCISNTNTCSSWEPYSTSKPWNLTPGDGEKIVYAWFKDGSGNGNSTPYSDSILLDTIGPTGSILINGGTDYTNSTSVTLTLSASDEGSGIYQMRFSNDGSNWSSWEAYNPSRIWNLTAGDGIKTVYAQFRDNALNASSNFTDTILLDTTPPTGSIVINGGETYAYNILVNLTLSASDSGSGVSQIRLSNNPGGPWTEPEPFTPSKHNWDLSKYGGNSNPGYKTVYVQYKDSAGNWSDSFSAGIYYNPLKTFPFFDDFSTDKGWTGYEIGGWERGPALAGGGENGNPDPGEDYSPSEDNYILGFIIGSDYSNDIQEEKSIISPPIDCTGQKRVFLKFRRWLNVERNESDHARIYVSTNGSDWTQVWENPSVDLMDNQWMPVVIDISDIASNQATVYIKFTMGPTNSSRRFSGWNIDDFEVTSRSVYPSEGAFGTKLEIYGSGFGAKRGKVFLMDINGHLYSAFKIIDWKDDFISCSVSKAINSGIYNIVIQPSESKGTSILYEKAFVVRNPEIYSIDPSEGTAWDEVTVEGKFFGTKKGKISLEYEEGGQLSGRPVRF